MTEIPAGTKVEIIGALPLDIVSNGNKAGDMMEKLLQARPIVRTAHDIISERGWGRRAWAQRKLMNSPVKTAGALKRSHVRFSVPGALQLAAAEHFKEEPMLSLAVLRAYNVLVSVLVTSPFSHETILALPTVARVRMCSDIVNKGHGLMFVTQWNDHECESKDNALALLGKGEEMCVTAMTALKAEAN